MREGRCGNIKAAADEEETLQSRDIDLQTPEPHTVVRVALHEISGWLGGAPCSMTIPRAQETLSDRSLAAARKQLLLKINILSVT